ncbi:hypothetical protein N9N99_02405 [Gammaproteobacteria bacterium]|nr:hypothetical protein [Gammaproteobacteria bacterium]
MKINTKTIYTCVLIFAIMSMPYFQGYGYPYSLEVFFYGVGILSSPLIITLIGILIAKLTKTKLEFHKSFNVVGTIVLLGQIVQL